MSEEVSGSLSTKRGRKGAGFFHIDRRTWGAVCDLQDLNAAAAYLTLATGTGEGNDITKWSVKALRNHTGMRTEAAKLAIDQLMRSGFIAHGPEHSQAKPRYYLMPWDETAIAAKAKPKGFRATLMPSEDKPELIWLPNSLILSTASDGPPPVRMLRNANDLWALRLLIDLYHSHLLDSDGGVGANFVWSKKDMRRFGAQGVCTIWGYRGDATWVRWVGPLEPHQERKKTDPNGNHPVFDSLARLKNMGLIAFVSHLFPNDTADAEPAHSLGSTWEKGEPEEEAIRNAAHQAGIAMLQEGQSAQAVSEGYGLIPVPSYLDKAEVRGVLRMRFRPHTSATAKWHQALTSQGNEWVKRYGEQADAGRNARPARVDWEAYGT